jgi:AmmeMemoRadiSam system protein B
MLTRLPATSSAAIRQPAVAGSFYPGESAALARLVGRLLAEADRLMPVAGATDPLATRPIAGLLVPHAGLIYSGVVAATGWRLIGTTGPEVPLTVVMLGTNHGAGWLRGVGVWEAGAWRTPLGDVEVDIEVARRILEIGPPFVVDRRAHLGEHSLEVQLPFLRTVRRRARIVPLSVAAGPGSAMITAGERLGALLARLGDAGEPVVLAISSDMAHYPPSPDCTRATSVLLPPILDLDPAGLTQAERELVAGDGPGLVCGMCGIQPAVLGLAALRAAGATRGHLLAAATSADAGGPTDRTVGYLAVAFTG